MKAFTNLAKQIEKIVNYRGNRKSKLMRKGTILAALGLLDTDTSQLKIKDIVINQDNLRKLLTDLAEKGLDSLKLLLSELKFQSTYKDWADLTAGIANYNGPDLVIHLMTKGMPLVPSLYISEHKTTLPISYKHDSLPASHSGYDINEISQFVFIAWFYILTQARWPYDGGKIPKILTDSFGSLINLGTKCEEMLGAPLEKLDKKWILNFSYSTLPDNFKNRFALGCAGYRIPQAFAICTFKSDTPQKVLDLQIRIQKIINAPADKNMHPVFRNTTLITKYGSINKSLVSIMAQYCTDDTKKTLASNKNLYEEPRYVGLDQKIYNLDVNDFINNPIFP